MTFSGSSSLLYASSFHSFLTELIYLVFRESLGRVVLHYISYKAYSKNKVYLCTTLQYNLNWYFFFSFWLTVLAISWYKLTDDGFGFLVVLGFFSSIQGELDAEAEKMRVSQQDLIAVNESVYTPDSDVTSPAINRNLIQKAGYLNLRK